MNTQLGLTLKPGLKADNKYVGHVPMGLSFLLIPIFIFLKLAKVPVKVTGSRRLENGLVVPGSFLTRTTSRVMIRATKFEEEIIRLKSLCTHMDIKKREREKGEEVPSFSPQSPLPFPSPTPSLSTRSLPRRLEEVCMNAWSISKSLVVIKTKKVVAIKGTGSRLSACSLIKLRLFNLLLILSVNYPTHMYVGDLRVYFKVELYFRVTWSRMEEY